MKLRLNAIIFLSFITALGCSDAEFESGSEPSSSSGGTSSIDETGTPGDDDDDSTGTNNPEQTGPCVKNGVVQLKYPTLIQSCIDDGKIYNFDTESCTDMDKASFACDFENIIAEIKKLGLNPKGMEDGQAQNALMVGCGQANNGNTIVGQWWANPTTENDCTFETGKTSITTGCYQITSGNDPKPVTQEEIAAKVLECINGN